MSTGPDAIVGSTYSEISTEAERRRLAERRLGRWAGEGKAALSNGEVPPMVTGPWSTPDPFGAERPFTDTNPRDPSGVEKHRGID